MRIPMLVCGLLLAGAAQAAPQSHKASVQSTLSLTASAEVPVVALQALSQGGTFVVHALHASAQGVGVVLESAAGGASFTVRVSAETAAGLALAVGTTVAVSAIASGYLLSHAGQVFAFVPNARVRQMLHSREIA